MFYNIRLSYRKTKYVYFVTIPSKQVRFIISQLFFFLRKPAFYTS